MNRKNFFSTSFLAVALVLTLSVSSLAAAFPDVQNHWAKKEILWAADQKYVQGNELGRFNPQEKMTQVEFYRVINQFAGIKNKTTVEFSDVSPQKWYYDEVARGLSQGYLKSRPGKLYPEAKITRDEAARILGEVYQLPASPEALSAYTDRDSILNKGQVGALTKLGLMKGLPSGAFAPKEGLTRGEFCVLLYRAYEKLSLPQIYAAKQGTSNQKPVEKPKSPQVENRDKIKVEVSDYNLFKDRLLTKGYSLDEVNRLWALENGKKDLPKEWYWKNYNDFYWYFKKFNYSDREILKMWNDPDFRYKEGRYPLDWTRGPVSYEDFYRYYRDRGYSKAWILDQWDSYRKSWEAQSPWIYRDYSSFYKYYRDLGYDSDTIDWLYNNRFDPYYGQGSYYKFADYGEFYRYFKDYYSQEKIDQLWNGGHYVLVHNKKGASPEWLVLPN